MGRYIGIGLAVAAVVAPLAYCTVEEGRIKTNFERELASACLQAGGEWRRPAWYSTDRECIKP